MVNVTHDRDDRRSVFKQIYRLLDRCFWLLDDHLDLVDPLVLVAFFTLEGETVDFTNFCGDVWLKRLVRCWENSDLDQVRHDVERLQPETGGQIWNQDWGLDDDEFRIVGNFFFWNFDNGFRKDHRLWNRGGGDFGSFDRRVFLIEDLGNGADHRLAGAGGLADLRLLVLCEEIEGICLFLV